MYTLSGIISTLIIMMIVKKIRKCRERRERIRLESVWNTDSEDEDNHTCGVNCFLSAGGCLRRLIEVEEIELNTVDRRNRESRSRGRDRRSGVRDILFTDTSETPPTSSSSQVRMRPLPTPPHTPTPTPCTSTSTTPTTLAEIHEDADRSGESEYEECTLVKTVDERGNQYQKVPLAKEHADSITDDEVDIDVEECLEYYYDFIGERYLRNQDIEVCDVDGKPLPPNFDTPGKPVWSPDGYILTTGLKNRAYEYSLRRQLARGEPVIQTRKKFAYVDKDRIVDFEQDNLTAHKPLSTAAFKEVASSPKRHSLTLTIQKRQTKTTTGKQFY